jgi:hypothetical protein
MHKNKRLADKHKKALEKRRRQAKQNPNVGNTKLPRAKNPAPEAIQATAATSHDTGWHTDFEVLHTPSGFEILRRQDTEARTRPRKGNV